jgi:hypothetical protein
MDDYRFLCNDVQRESAKPGPDMASWLFCYVPLHKIWYGIHLSPFHFHFREVYVAEEDA